MWRTLRTSAGQAQQWVSEWVLKRHGEIPMGTPLMGASNAGVVGKNWESQRISGYWSMTAAVWTYATIHHAVYCTCCLASVNLCLSQPALTTTTKRREQNLFVHSVKSEAEVTNKRRLRMTYCTIEANYWQTRIIAQPLCDSRVTCCYNVI